LRVFFLDSNAVARRYFSDMGARVMRAIERYVDAGAEDSVMAYSSLAIVEVESVLQQLGSERRFASILDRAVRSDVMRRVLLDSQDDLVIQHSPQLETQARRLIRTHGLKTLDALHLAAAIEVHTMLTGAEQLTFVTSDTALVRAVDSMNVPNLESLDFLTCVCRACGQAFHPPIRKLKRRKQQVPCPHCGSPIRCWQCYRDITKCKNTWMPPFLQPYTI
jgi:predicted nucleic acid-binding protein